MYMSVCLRYILNLFLHLTVSRYVCFLIYIYNKEIKFRQFSALGNNPVVILTTNHRQLEGYKPSIKLERYKAVLDCSFECSRKMCNITFFPDQV